MRPIRHHNDGLSDVPATEGHGVSMKSTASSLALALAGIVAVSGCHQASRHASLVINSLPSPGGQAEDYQTRLIAARMEEQEGNVRSARKKYQKLVRENPTDPVVYHRLAVIAASDGDFDTANGNFRRANELSPADPELLADWGYSLFLQGQFEEAEELTRQGAELDPSNARIANNLQLMFDEAMGRQQVEQQYVHVLPMVSQDAIVAEAYDAGVDATKSSLVEQAGFEETGQSLTSISLPTPAEEESVALPEVDESSAAAASGDFEDSSSVVSHSASGALSDDLEIDRQPGASDTSELNEPFPIDPADQELELADAASPDRSSIAPEHIQKLLTRARLELASGDVLMSHAFAEAAAEITIPLQTFQDSPEKILDEIEFVTGHNSVMALQNPALATAEFAQVVPPAPAANEEASASPVSLKSAFDQAAANDPQGFRAIGRESMSILPKLVDSDGERRLLPERRAFRKLSQLPTVDHNVGYSRDWMPLSYSWEAPQLKYNPLYFEDVQLERYGNEVCILQPFLSGARFYATLPTLPYQMMSEGNSVCHTVYDLGHDRPGNCVPYALEVPPFSWTGSLASGGWVYALIVILP